LLFLCSLCLCDEPSPPYRSPIDLVVLPDGRRALTANHTADSVTLIDLDAGKVLAEQKCGRKPAAVACSRDGKRVAVSNLWSGTVTLLAVEKGELRTVAEVAVGPFPRGLAFAHDGGTLYAAVAGSDEVVQFDCGSHKVLQRWPAPREPRSVVLSADGHWLAAASARARQVHGCGRTPGAAQWEDGVW